MSGREGIWGGEDHRSRSGLAEMGWLGVGRVLAEGVGFEPTRELSPPTRLAGGRTRPLCDPSARDHAQYSKGGEAANLLARKPANHTETRGWLVLRFPGSRLGRGRRGRGR